MLKTVTPGEALSILYSAFGARRTEAEACPLALARGRVLAEDVEETVAILGLLHDVCKVGVYHKTDIFKAALEGKLDTMAPYEFRDPLPLGHGEKSLYLIQRHMDLEPEEALAIRWHMGAYDNAVKGDGRALSAAMEATPWVWRLHQADMCAAWVDEREAAEE